MPNHLFSRSNYIIFLIILFSEYRAFHFITKNNYRNIGDLTFFYLFFGAIVSGFIAGNSKIKYKSEIILGVGLYLVFDLVIFMNYSNYCDGNDCKLGLTALLLFLAFITIFSSLFLIIGSIFGEKYRKLKLE